MTVLRYKVEKDIAWLAMNNPPLNALSHELRQAIVAGLDNAVADKKVRAIVLIGNDRAFSSGADVAWLTDELDQPERVDRVLAAQGRWDLLGNPVGIVLFALLSWATTLASAIVVAGTGMMVLGLAIAYLFYIRRPDLPVELARTQPMLYQFLLNKWYFDELYDLIFVRAAKRLGRFLWKVGDGYIIDGFGPDGVSARVLDVTRNVVRLQTGYLYHYAFAMLIGVAGLITWYQMIGKFVTVFDSFNAEKEQSEGDGEQ